MFQRRKDGSVDFFLNFVNYSRGFGDLEGEFWLGNEFLHRLTREGVHELRVDLSDFYDNHRYAKHGLFRVGDVSDSYRLTVRSYSGNAGRYKNFVVFLKNLNLPSFPFLLINLFATKNCIIKLQNITRTSM